MSKDFNGKVAAVTGAASGIGLATAKALMDAGATVVLVDRSKAALGDIVAASGGKAIAQVTDLLDPERCAMMIPEIIAKAGRIDILHCNVSNSLEKGFFRTFDADANGVVACAWFKRHGERADAEDRSRRGRTCFV